MDSTPRPGDFEWVGLRRLAGEALADVDSRKAVDVPLAGEERNVLGGPEGDDRVRVVAAERGPRHVAFRRADDRELAGRRQVQVERAERVPQ